MPAAYGLARLRFRGNRPIGIAIFLTYLIPPTILFIPFSQFVGALHIDNTIWSLILTYPTFTVPFCTWLLMGFFRSVRRRSRSARSWTARADSRCCGTSSFRWCCRAS